MSAARKAWTLIPRLPKRTSCWQAQHPERRWQWVDAEAEYRRALDSNPSDSAAHIGFAGWLLCQGRTDEAVAWAKRARELDPLGTAGTSIGYILFEARHYHEAIQSHAGSCGCVCRRSSAFWYLGFALIANDQPGEAIPVLEKALSVSERSPGVIGVLIRAYAHAGRRSDALRILEELKKRGQAGYVPAGAFVNAYLGLGDNEQAFAWMERAYQEQSNILQFLKVHPFFDPLRSDPRFTNLVRRVGLG